MAARTVPVMPSFLAGQKLTATLLNQVGAYATFWANPPMFRMVQSIAQSVPNTTYTQITMDTSLWDSDSGRAGGTPYAYTIPVGMSGRWQFTVKVEWAPNATGTRLCTVARNGATDSTVEIADPTTSATYTPGTATVATLAVNAGDVMSPWGYQDSGGALNTASGASGKSFFEGRLISLGNP